MEYNLADLFECVVDAVGGNEALICGDRRLTYAQLDERANRLAHVLERHGVGPGDHIGVYQYNGTEYVECMLAAFKVRAAPININYRYVEQELRYLFDNADLVGVVHHRQFAPRIAAVAKDCPKLRLCISVEDGSGADLGPTGSLDYDEALASSSSDRGFGPRSGRDLFVIYTGGTTGMPKGVMWQQEDLFFAGMGGGNPNGPPITAPEQIGVQAAQREHITMFPAAPLMHGAAELGTFITLNWGDRGVLVPRFDAAEVLRIIEREGVNTLSIVGDAMARPLAEALAVPGASYDLSSLFIISSAGAILSESVRDALTAHLPNVMILDSFGASETGFQGMAAPGSSPDKGLRFQLNERHAVLDEDLRPVAPGSGVVGRVAQRGRVPVGYYKDPRKTAETFVEIDGERYVLLGDMARVEPDGTVTVLGRGTVCINSGGEKIFPEEVEAALKAHPDVFDAVVVGVPDERWSERVVAVVQPRSGSAPTLPELDAHCRRRIAGYKVPRGLVVVDEIVRSPAGKPDYPWARALAAAQAR